MISSPLLFCVCVCSFFYLNTKGYWLVNIITLSHKNEKKKWENLHFEIKLKARKKNSINCLDPQNNVFCLELPFCLLHLLFFFTVQKEGNDITYFVCFLFRLYKSTRNLLFVGSLLHTGKMIWFGYMYVFWWDFLWKIREDIYLKFTQLLSAQYYLLPLRETSVIKSSSCIFK